MKIYKTHKKLKTKEIIFVTQLTKKKTLPKINIKSNYLY